VDAGSSSTLPPTSDKAGEARALYADLVAHGLPVILATPHQHRTSGKYPCKDGCDTELDHGAGWADISKPDATRLNNYRPGEHTVAMVSGHGLDAIDIDSKNGASVEAEIRRAAECGVVIVGMNFTPSVGAHFLVASTGIATAAKPSNGVDFRGGCADGSGRGLVYLPGSSRPKYRDTGGEYTVVVPIDWHRLAAVDLDQQREAISRYLQQVGITPRLSAAKTATTSTAQGTLNLQAEDLPEELPAALVDKIEDLDAAPVGKRSERFYHLVGECYRAGLTEGQTLKALTPWCAAVGKYVGREAEQVAAVWAKIRDDETLGGLLPDPTPATVNNLTPEADLSESQGQDDDQGHAVTPGDEVPEGLRRIVLTCAAEIEPLPTVWTWDGRLPVGALGLIAGPEGTGKSTVAYWIAARITKGELPGIHLSQPRDVLIAATEDSWARTIVPRLIAAGADLNRVWRVDVVTVLGTGGYLTLPKDIGALKQQVQQVNAALLLLDPIMSRLEAGLDTHKDAETRRALEPIAALADTSGMSVLGLIHFNKGGSSEVLNNVMASKAFTAVARSVSTVIRDPSDDTGRTRIFGTPKSNLGRDDLPLLPFQLAEHTFPNKAGDIIVTSRIEWLDERIGTMDDLMRQSRESGQDRSIAAEVADWLSGYLDDSQGIAPRTDIVKAAKAEGYNEEQLKRGRKHAQVQFRNTRTKPRRTYWMTAQRAKVWDSEAEESQSGHSQGISRGESLTNLTTQLGAKSGSQVSQGSPHVEQPDCAPGVQVAELSRPTGPTCSFCGEPLPPMATICACGEIAEELF
jgi:hypothetical protein